MRSAMPSFYEKMKTRLRSADEGADTVVWLALSDAALSHSSGLFYQGINLTCPPTYYSFYVLNLLVSNILDSLSLGNLQRISCHLNKNFEYKFN